jgi:hypothetical protein
MYSFRTSPTPVVKVIAFDTSFLESDKFRPMDGSTPWPPFMTRYWSYDFPHLEKREKKQMEERISITIISVENQNLDCLEEIATGISETEIVLILSNSQKKETLESFLDIREKSNRHNKLTIGIVTSPRDEVHSIARAFDVLITPDKSEAAEVAELMLNIWCDYTSRYRYARGDDELIQRIQQRGLVGHFLIKGKNQNIIKKTKDFLSTHNFADMAKSELTLFLSGGPGTGLFLMQDICEAICINLSDDVDYKFSMFLVNTEDNISVLGILFDSEKTCHQ